MSTTKRTKIILSVAMSLSLALNFFFVGWMAGSSPFVPEPPGRPFGPRVEGDRPPEVWFVDMLTMGMSEDGRRQVSRAMEKHTQEIEDLKRQADDIKRQTVATLLEEKPDTAQIRNQAQELEAVMQRRLAVMHNVLIPVVSQLDFDDRKAFARRWETGPKGGPRPPPR